MATHTGHHRGPARRRRVRYDKLAALLLATGVTGFALVSGIGQVAGGTSSSDDTPTPSAAQVPPSASPSWVADQIAVQQKLTSSALASTALPSGSGSGRRVVFDISAQRVWLVDRSDAVQRTYLVSGSVTDNLGPGHYSVYSRSRNAVGVDDSGTMQYFVRFTRGKNAAIGFHDIPVDNGRQVQTVAQLGQPMSHGCIRQKSADAKRMWAFADLGTKVDVVA